GVACDATIEELIDVVSIGARETLSGNNRVRLHIILDAPNDGVLGAPADNQDLLNWSVLLLQRCGERAFDNEGAGLRAPDGQICSCQERPERSFCCEISVDRMCLQSGNDIWIKQQFDAGLALKVLKRASQWA